MSKRIVICCDGSWNAPTQKDSRSGKFNPTNVIKLASAIRLADAHGQQQIVFYDEGVGTGGLLDKWVGGLFGAGLSKNVLDAYRFLVENYEPDDQIYLFGFSRGAYTVRSVVGLITNCGILKREHLAHLSEAYDLYRRRDAASKPNKPASRLFRKRYAHPQESVSIACLGVWDTMGALGIPGLPGLNKRWAFHDNGLSTLVKHAYHALAIDEKRRPFAPVLWRLRKSGLPTKNSSLNRFGLPVLTQTLVAATLTRPFLISPWPG